MSTPRTGRPNIVVGISLIAAIIIVTMFSCMRPSEAKCTVNGCAEYTCKTNLVCPDTCWCDVPADSEWGKCSNEELDNN